MNFDEKVNDRALRQTPPDVERILRESERQDRIWRRVRSAIVAAVITGILIWTWAALRFGWL